MGRIERKRYENNDHVAQLLKESDKRSLTSEEIEEIRTKYTGIGGLTSSDWANGQFFTPPVVTKFVIDLIGVQSEDMVLEPSCGGGAFLSTLPEGCKALGIEWFHETAKVARLIHPNATIHQGDALEMKEETDGKFDIVVGNPPYMNIAHKKSYKGFEFTRFSKRAEWYFIEMALDALKPGGICALIVPDGILGNSKDQPLRKWVLDHNYLRAVISLPTETFKLSGTTVKTSVMVVQKPFEGEVIDKDYQILMAISKEVGWDSRGRSTGKCDLPEILTEFKRLHPNLRTRKAPDRIEEPKNMSPEPIQQPTNNVIDLKSRRKEKKECPQLSFLFDETVNG